MTMVMVSVEGVPENRLPVWQKKNFYVKIGVIIHRKLYPKAAASDIEVIIGSASVHGKNIFIKVEQYGRPIRVSYETSLEIIGDLHDLFIEAFPDFQIGVKIVPPAPGEIYLTTNEGCGVASFKAEP